MIDIFRDSCDFFTYLGVKQSNYLFFFEVVSALQLALFISLQKEPIIEEPNGMRNIHPDTFE